MCCGAQTTQNTEKSGNEKDSKFSLCFRPFGVVTLFLPRAQCACVRAFSLSLSLCSLLLSLLKRLNKARIYIRTRVTELRSFFSVVAIGKREKRRVFARTWRPRKERHHNHRHHHHHHPNPYREKVSLLFSYFQMIPPTDTDEENNARAWRNNNKVDHR